LETTIPPFTLASTRNRAQALDQSSDPVHPSYGDEYYSWSYGERASIGFLAAAAWQSGAVALEEWGTHKYKSKKRCRGRCDLYIFHKNQEFYVEAKFMRTRAENDDADLAPIRAKLQPVSGVDT